MSLSSHIRLVYVVEDNTIYSEMICNHLNRNYPQFAVRCFATGEEMLPNLSLKPHLFIVDYHLDGKNSKAVSGEVILHWVTTLYPDVPVLMITGTQNLSSMSHLLYKGAKALITKDDNMLPLIDEAIWGEA